MTVRPWSSVVDDTARARLRPRPEVLELEDELTLTLELEELELRERLEAKAAARRPRRLVRVDRSEPVLLSHRTPGSSSITAFGVIKAAAVAMEAWTNIFRRLP